MTRPSFVRFLLTMAIILASVAFIASGGAIRDKGPDAVADTLQKAIELLRPIGDSMAVMLSGPGGTGDGAAGTSAARSPAARTPDAGQAEIGDGLPEPATSSTIHASAEPNPPSGAPSETAPAEDDGPIHRADGADGTDDRLGRVCEAAPTSDQNPVVMGDVIRLRLFEHSRLVPALSSGEGAAAGAAGPGAIMFERLDLSGSYAIGSDGTVSLPAMGHLGVVGRSLACVEELVARRAQERMRLQADATVAFVSRPPVLVHGTVRIPGAHQYAPGMDVERILVKAGARERVAQIDPAQRVALKAHQDELTLRLASLILAHGRITAAMNDSEALDMAPAKLGTVTDILGRQRVESERATLRAELEARATAEAHRQLRLETLHTDVVAAEAQLAAAKEQLGYLEQRRGEVTGLLESGIVTDAKQENAVSRVMDMERLVLDKQDALRRLRAEVHLFETEVALARSQRRSRLTREARDTAKERDALQGQIASVTAQLDMKYASVPRSIMIERRGPSGTTRIAADLDTPVRPGDLLTVTLEIERERLLAQAEPAIRDHQD